MINDIERDDLLFVTPETFGAVGDGVTNDIECIQSAINYASLNNLNVKLVPNKVYYVDFEDVTPNRSPLVIPS